MNITHVAVLAAGLLIGAAVAGCLVFWVMRKRIAGLWAEASARAGNEHASVRAGLTSELRTRVERIDELLGERETLQRELNTVRSAQAAALATLDAERRAVDDKVLALRADGEKLEARMREAFSSLSATALEAQSKQMLELAKLELGRVSESAKVDLEARQKAIDASIRPVDETLKRVGESLTGMEKARQEGNAQLYQHLKTVASETSNLVKALRRPSVRGRWGEHTLRRVVEMAQMQAHVDFDEQTTIEGLGESGKLRPDLVIRMAGGRNVVVDAKAPLDKYLDMVEEPDDLRRAELLKAHTAQVRDHIAKLSAKTYWEALSPAPELVIMFVPSESLMSAALQDDPSLLEFGTQRQVILASPTTLIVLLRAVAYGWRQEQVAQNAEEIRELGQELYTRVRIMMEPFAQLGRELSSAVSAYNRTTASLEKRVLTGARRFVELGAAAGKEPEEAQPIELVVAGPTPQGPRKVGARQQEDMIGKLLGEG